MMNIAERKQSSALADAQGWLAQFEAALQAQDAAAAAALFLADGLWRDLLAFTWTVQTMAGRDAIAQTMRETLARTKP
jgi:putative flavoprotein involved in K+ transport